MFTFSYAQWASLSMETLALGMESSAVIGMRLTQFATGADPDGTEMRRMVSEKVASAVSLQTAMLAGTLSANPAGARKVVRHYRGKVRANRRRLG